MKAKLFVIGWFMLVLSACTSTKVPEPVEGPSPELCAIDSWMWRQPDSALACLLPYFDTCCRDALNASPTMNASRENATDSITRRNHCVSTTFDRHYANLLLSELLYKNDSTQTNRTELLQAVVYFDSLSLLADTRGASLQHRLRKDALRASAKNIAFLDARAHYINGVGYYEKDSAVEACKEYLKALEVMENHFVEKELVEHKAKFMALTYSHLTNLYSDLYLHDQAIYFGKESLVCYDKYNVSTDHVVWTLNEIGSNYDMMEQLDSADYYYRKAIHILGDTSASMFRDLVAHQAYLECKRDIHKSNTAILILSRLLSKSESSCEITSRYSYIGEILFHEEQLDSAWMYFSKVFQETPNIGLKKHAAERLVEICKAQRRNQVILQYADFLVPFANQEENKSEIKSQMTELYKTFVQEKLERQHKKEISKNNRQALATIAGMLFVILIISLLYHKNRRHKQDLETLIESERQAHKLQQAALAGRLKRSNAALKEHSKMIHTTIPLQNSTIEKYEDEPICKHILALCNDKKKPIKSTVPISAYADIALNDIQKAQLKNAAFRHYSPMFNKLKQECPKLNDKDLQYCYLSLLGLDNVQIAVFLQHSISTIWERENRLKRILGSEDRVAVILHGFMIN